MASIRDYNAVEQFNRSKLLDQALGEELNDRVAQLCQEHRQYMSASWFLGIFCPVLFLGFF